MKKLVLLLLPLLLWACDESDDPKMEITGSLVGYVMDADACLPLSGVMVNLSPSGESQITGVDGSFAFVEIEAQDYAVTFTASGYEKYTRRVTVNPGSVSNVDVALFKLESPDEPDDPNNPDTPDNPNTPDEPNNPDTPDEPSVPDYSEAEVSVGTLDNIEANLVKCVRNGSSVVLTYTLTNTYPYANMNVTLNNVNAFTQKTIIADNLGNQYEKKFVKLSLAGKNFGFGNNIEGTLLPDMPTKCEVTVNNVDADATHMTYYIYTSTALPGSVNYSDNVVLKNVKIH